MIFFIFFFICTYVRDLFNMTIHFGDRLHVHMSYLRQPLFRDTSLIDRSSCECYTMLLCHSCSLYGLNTGKEPS